MRPLILHNVPDDELYTGEDGIQRPYAMIFPEGDRQPSSISRTRRPIAETGSFGKSTRRTRSRTGSAPPKREDATMRSADEVFGKYLSQQEKLPSGASDRKSSYAQQDESASNAATSQPSRFVQEPVEIILRGYSSPNQQYAAINHYEQLAGRICEDYPREPPIESRRYKSELRDPAYTRRQPLTNAERTKVSRIANGEHWVKVTFESAEAAEAASYASPQRILGHMVYAEHFLGRPPAEDIAILDHTSDAANMDPLINYALGGGRRPSQKPRPKSWATTPSSQRTNSLQQQGSPSESMTSTQTIDTATASSGTAVDTHMGNSSSTSGAQPSAQDASIDSAYCRRLTTARRMTLKPAEEALAPQSSALERLLVMIPLIGWFSGSIIGNQVPRNDMGEFDMAKASLYWQIMFYLDLWFGLFGKELVSGDKDD